ncbi:hypothetical protein R1sor_001511 [Riccia sorocarpa]|uniref:Glucosidase 2 subunit beta n=1 Tax=Riccia sorocarpa TaxID=122646 RepID=A0ABD3GYT3_9MARC
MRGIGIMYFLVSVSAVLLFSVDSGTALNLRGVAPQDEKYYQSAVIKCRDGSKSFPQERLNDDFCDCADGTDEPGTNACPEAKFYCRNSGHRPLILFSSRVNDGICDCCDGSDEYDGKINCRNTCWEAGEKSREKLKKKLGVYKEGSGIRKKDVENSRILRRQHEGELVPLKRDEKHLKSVVDKLREIKLVLLLEMSLVAALLWWQCCRRRITRPEKEAVEKEEKRAREEKERLEKEEREKRERESTPAKEASQQAEDVSHQVEEQAEDPKIPRTTEEEEEVVDNSEHTDEEDDELANLTEEERGRVIAARWTGEDVSDIKAKAEAESANPLESTSSYDDESEALDEANVQPEDVEDEDYGHHSAYEDASIESESLDDDEASWWSRLKAAPSALLKMFSFSRSHPVDISEAERIRKEFREASDKLQGVQSRITELEDRLKQDYGKDGEFYSFHDKCFELKDKKYTYKVCPFKDATQQEGHSTTRLGRWQGFKDDYKSMVYEHGDRCWNGPERSLRVKMRCGTKLELRSVDEPSRCEYVAELSTPAMCLESKVKELERQLVVQEIPQDGSHDEL